MWMGDGWVVGGYINRWWIDRVMYEWIKYILMNGGWISLYVDGWWVGGYINGWWIDGG